MIVRRKLHINWMILSTIIANQSKGWDAKLQGLIIYGSLATEREFFILKNFRLLPINGKPVEKLGRKTKGLSHK